MAPTTQLHVLLLAVLACGAVSGVWAAEGRRAGFLRQLIEAGTGARDLLQFRPPQLFPYSRCGSYHPAGQPYYLSDLTSTVDEMGIATYNLTIKYKGAIDKPSDCYAALTKSLHKVMLHVYTECIPAINVADNYATLNGKRKTMIIYPSPTGSSLTVTALGLDSVTADGAQLVIKAAAPCDLPQYLFRLSEEHGRVIEVVFSESSAHKCCGRNF